MCPPIEEKQKAPFVMLVSALSRKHECQPFLRSKLTEHVTKRNTDSKSVWVESVKSYTLMMQGSSNTISRLYESVAD